MPKSICIIAFSPIARDARVLRQIKYLAPHYRLNVIGYGPPPPEWAAAPGVTWQAVATPALSLAARLSGLLILTLLGRLSARFYDPWYWRLPHRRQALLYALASQSDAYHANDWDALPIAAAAARHHGARLVFDAHEFAPLEWEGKWFWRTFAAPAISHVLHSHAASLDAAMTVAPAIAQRYREEFHFEPIVVLNAPEAVAVSPQPAGSAAVGLIHHGGANPDRRLEILIETVARCNRRYHLHFMLVDDGSPYSRHLRALAEEIVPGRVTFHAPVAPPAVVPTIASYDVGFYPLAPTSYNNRVALPNKFFDFLAAGLAVCIGPSPAMAAVVRQYGCGCIAPSFQPADLAATLNRLDSAQLASMRQAARVAAGDLNAEKEMGKVVALYRQLLPPQGER